MTVEAPIPVGIGESDLKAAVELRLRNAGVKIATGVETILAPRFFVSVTAPIGELAMFGARVSLAQFVKPYRPEESTAPALVLDTWLRDRVDTVSKGVVLIPTRALVEKVIDDFASDYMKANPK